MANKPFLLTTQALTADEIYRAAEAIRLELRTLNIKWFVDDVADPVDGSREMTPYNLLAEAALKAARNG